MSREPTDCALLAHEAGHKRIRLLLGAGVGFDHLRGLDSKKLPNDRVDGLLPLASSGLDWFLGGLVLHVDIGLRCRLPLNSEACVVHWGKWPSRRGFRC